jgi:AraC-like DNA-binding protein/mannose-6-phosphate isomerase-like protein (cupin superfamily)
MVNPYSIDHGNDGTHMNRSTQLISLPSSADQHDHHYHQLVFGLEGETEFELVGHSREVSIGHGCLVPCSTEHIFSGLGDNRILVVNLPAYSEDRQQQERVEQLFRSARYFNCPPQLQLLLHTLSREVESSPEDSLLLEACSNTLLCSLQRQLEYLPLPQPRGMVGRLNLELLDDYLELHIERRISVAELAGLFCLSSSQFFARFKTETGRTPQEYVSEYRLRAVRSALENSAAPIAQLAGRFGFCSQSALTRAFSQRFQISPAHYRRQHGQALPEDLAKQA